MSVEDFSRDMKRMGDIFGHVCSGISIIGGEPLIHPEIVSLMKIACENFIGGIIQVFTNGTLLPSMPRDFWEACRKYDIGINISAYPIKLDTGKIDALAREYGVKVSLSRAQNAT